MLGKATHYNLIIVEMVGTDVFAPGDTVKALIRGFMWLLLTLYSFSVGLYVLRSLCTNCEEFNILLIIFKLKQIRKGFETSTFTRKLKRLRRPLTMTWLCTVKRMGIDVCALGDTVKLSPENYVWLLLMVMSFIRIASGWYVSGSPCTTTTNLCPLKLGSVRLAHNHDIPLNQRLEHLPFAVFTKPCSVTTAIPSLILCVTNLTRLDGNINVWYIYLYRQSR